MLVVENLTKYYRRHLAVDDLSFHVNAGEIVGLLGPNGAGKTTVLRSICGILKLSSGRVTIAGHNLQEQEIDAKRSIAFVPEVPNPYELLTVREHLRFVAMAYGETEDLESRMDALLDRLDLSEKSDALVLTLSKGMKQKLAVACGFIHNAQVLLFDEPLIGIDPKGQRELRTMIEAARDEGRAVLISTHLLDTAERLCDRVMILMRGRKVVEGTLAEIQDRVQFGEDARLEDMFLHLTETTNEF
ncbi:MAG: ABC transporter ATP-binding protein [Armatimonadetes bacterium]|nr:ABC transporter ATP-binding protein [Armatimonadota bacterium]